MTFEQFETDIMKATFARMLELSESKGREYASTGKAAHSERFGNFNRLAAELNLPPDKILWVYLKKHLDSISHHINTKESFSEPVEGRIDDAILYLLLLKGLWREMAQIKDMTTFPENVIGAGLDKVQPK